jgi:hypothetical protein
VINDTTGQQWAVEMPYSGTATTAEWILEAPTDLGVQSTLGTYSPPVTFSAVHFGGTQGPLTRLEMGQGGQIVSTPSDVNNDSFTVAHGSLPPPTP